MITNEYNLCQLVSGQQLEWILQIIISITSTEYGKHWRITGKHV